MNCFHRVSQKASSLYQNIEVFVKKNGNIMSFYPAPKESCFYGHYG